ncbi:MAG TPA: DUF6691 family protein [Thermomicrobiales bacterium]|nr:DUF6691 family protein [Thermomicrobiales bacterium]
MTINRLGLLFGVIFGFTVRGARLTDYDVIHRMLKFQDLEPFLIMGSAVGVAAPLLWMMERRGWVTPLGGKLTFSRSSISRHHVTGSMLFGTGWAIAGTCPAPALAMIGSGRVLGLVTVVGIFGGVMLRDAVVAREATRVAAPPVIEPATIGV